jgi:phospholipid/cholesterol/gamma-HCH transport system substrate-binding protein
MEAVSGFVRENKEALSRNIKGLVSVTDVLVKQRKALDEVLSAAPTALSNLFHTYNPSTGTLDTRANLNYNEQALLEDPIGTLCSLVSPVEPTGEVCDQLEAALPDLTPEALQEAVQGGGGGGGGGGLGGLLDGVAPRASTEDSPVSRRPMVIEPIDRSLAGLVEVTR